jgi:ComF family protein
MYQAIRGRVNIELASAHLYYAGDNASKHLIHDFKYHGVKGVGYHLATLFAKRLLDAQCFSDYDLIVPVPLHRRKALKRGFNQSAIIARGLSEVLGIHMASNVLIRRRYKRSQTQKSRFSRWRNMEGIYTVTHPELIKDKRILLVDDVFTTGATMEACVNALHTASPRAISLATLAYTE